MSAFGRLLTLIAGASLPLLTPPGAEAEQPEAPSAAPVIGVEQTPFEGSSLYLPNDGARHPAVILFHGSEGGGVPFWRLHAQFLAAHGYAALAYCYFDCGYPLQGPHETLSKIELDSAHKAFKWLAGHDRVRGGLVSFYGVSRGAELAVLLASLAGRDGLKAPASVVSHAASDVAYGAWNFDWTDSRCWLCEGGACPQDGDGGERAWSPACGPSPLNENGAFIGPKMPSWTWRGEPIAPGAPIEFGHFDGPALLTHGEKDALTPASAARRLAKRLDAGGADRAELHIFDGETHLFSRGAEDRRWALVLDFLARHSTAR